MGSAFIGYKLNNCFTCTAGMHRGSKLQDRKNINYKLFVSIACMHCTTLINKLAFDQITFNANEISHDMFDRSI